MRMKPNEFTSYELTELERAKGWNVSPETQANLRNEQSTLAAEIITMRIENKEMGEEEKKALIYKQGKLHMLQDILSQIALYSQDLDLMIQEDSQFES